MPAGVADGKAEGPVSKTLSGQGEWNDGTWPKPGQQLPTIAGDISSIPKKQTTTSKLPPKQKPSPGDREENSGGRDPSDTDANDSSTNDNDGFDPSAPNPGVSTSEVSDTIGHPDFGVDAEDKSDDSGNGNDGGATGHGSGGHHF